MGRMPREVSFYGITRNYTSSSSKTPEAAILENVFLGGNWDDCLDILAYNT